MAHHASTRAAVRLDSVTKVYGRGGGAVTAIDNVSVSVPPGTFTAVMGPSGSGKSTFLHCAAGLDRPTSGSVYLGSAGTDLSTLPEAELTKLRRNRIGFVFQAFNLLAALNVRENVTLPLRLAGRRAGRARLAETLARVGLSDRGGHLPSQLSGGELDTVTAREILKLLRHAVDSTGQTTVMVTHDPVAACYADSVIFLADGRIAEIVPGLSADQIADRMTHLGAWA